MEHTRRGFTFALENWYRVEQSEPDPSTLTDQLGHSLTGRATRRNSPEDGSSVSPAVPIAILPPTPSFSSSAQSFNLRSPPPLPPSTSFSPSSNDPTALLDGPLTDLLPSVIGSPASGSSTDEGNSLITQGGGPAWSRRGIDSSIASPRTIPTTRSRIVSAPLGLWSTSTSPPRSSPLSQSFSSMFDEPSLPPSYLPSSPSSSRPTPIPTSHRRRRSSTSLHQHPPFGSLVGSFENSLLSGRMSTLPSKPLPFTCSIGVLGSPSNTHKKLQCPKHLHVDFGAVFYESRGEEKRTSPYLGNVDLENHYVSLLTSSSEDDEKEKRLPKFPGYQVPVRGQVQIVLKNSNQTAFKPFLVPYDLEGLNRGGKGGRTFLRQKSYSVVPPGDGERFEGKGGGRLRFAVHLTFCSPPISSAMKRKRSDGEKEKEREPKYYLYQSIRVVFASQALDPTEKVRVVLEGPADLLHGSKGAIAGEANEAEVRKWRASQFGEYRGPGEEWEMCRKELRDRKEERLRRGGESRLSSHDEEGRRGRGAAYDDNIPATSYDTHRYTIHSEIPTTSSFANLPFPPSIDSPLDTVPPSVPTSRLPPHPLSISTTFSSPVSPIFPPLHPAPAPLLTFDRVPSPIPSELASGRGISRDRKQSHGVSGLALSRPNSPFNGVRVVGHDREARTSSEPRNAQSRERELCGR
ncbi:hypothetical protein JCM16303_007430 [Sporobolomyces ruberrimus]